MFSHEPIWSDGNLSLAFAQVEISCPKESLSGIYNCLNLRRGLGLSQRSADAFRKLSICTFSRSGGVRLLLSSIAIAALAIGSVAKEC